MTFWRLELDYDNVPFEDVDEDCKILVQRHPELGSYRIELSKSGRGHFHVIFPKSNFTRFNDAYEIAQESHCHREWLALCKEYQVFGLETDQTRSLNDSRLKQIVNKPTKLILSPWLLDIEPTSSLDARRIVRICESIKDDTWVYNAFIHLSTLKQHVIVGCRDRAQAERRAKWLRNQADLDFTETIKENKQNKQNP